MHSGLRCCHPPGERRHATKEQDQTQTTQRVHHTVDHRQQAIGQPGMLDPMPIRHGVGVGIGLRQPPALGDQIQPGAQMPSQVRLYQRLQREIQNEADQKTIEQENDQAMRGRI